MAMEPEGDDLKSIDEDFSTSNDDKDFPKYLNIRFDFCVEDEETLEFDGDWASVKFPL